MWDSRSRSRSRSCRSCSIHETKVVEYFSCSISQSDIKTREARYMKRKQLLYSVTSIESHQVLNSCIFSHSISWMLKNSARLPKLPLTRVSRTCNHTYDNFFQVMILQENPTYLPRTHHSPHHHQPTPLLILTNPQ